MGIFLIIVLMGRSLGPKDTESIKTEETDRVENSSNIEKEEEIEFRILKDISALLAEINKMFLDYNIDKEIKYIDNKLRKLENDTPFLLCEEFSGNISDIFYKIRVSCEKAVRLSEELSRLLEEIDILLGKLPENYDISSLHTRINNIKNIFYNRIKTNRENLVELSERAKTLKDKSNSALKNLRNRDE